MGLETREILAAAGTKWNFHGYVPGLVGGHCIGVDPYYLTHKAQSIGFHPEMILAGRRINDGMAQWVALDLVKLMLRHKLEIGRARILVMGLTFKENCPDIRNSKVVDLVRELALAGRGGRRLRSAWPIPPRFAREYDIESVATIPEGRFGTPPNPRGRSGRPGADTRCRHRHGRRRPAARRPHAGRGVVGARPHRSHAAHGARRTSPARARPSRIQLVAGPAEQLPFPDATFDAPDIHLPPALRGRSGGDAAGAGPGGEARAAAWPAWSSTCRPGRFWRCLVVALHPLRPPGGGRPGGPGSWFEVGRFLGPNISEHYRRYPLPSTVEAWRDAGLVDVGVRADEPRRRAGHVGAQRSG